MYFRTFLWRPKSSRRLWCNYDEVLHTGAEKYVHFHEDGIFFFESLPISVFPRHAALAVLSPRYPREKGDTKRIRRGIRERRGNAVTGFERMGLREGGSKKSGYLRNCQTHPIFAFYCRKRFFPDGKYCI